MDDQTISSQPGTTRSSSKKPPTAIERIHFDIEVLSGRLRFLWLKRVDAYDPSVHCARCLIGEYSELLAYGRPKKGTRIIGDVEVPAGSIWYLCGVTNEYDRNIHLPMQQETGVSFGSIGEDLRVQIDGAVMLDLPELPDGYKGKSREFTTCRNWQFGEHAVLTGLIPTVGS